MILGANCPNFPAVGWPQLWNKCNKAELLQWLSESIFLPYQVPGLKFSLTVTEAISWESSQYLVKCSIRKIMHHPHHTTPWDEHTRLCTGRWVPGLAQTFAQTLCVLFQGLSLKHNLEVCWEPCYVALCIVLGDYYTDQPWLKTKALFGYQARTQDTGNWWLRSRSNLVMATGIQADWFKNSPQLCAHYLAVTAASVL